MEKVTQLRRGTKERREEERFTWAESRCSLQCVEALRSGPFEVGILSFFDEWLGSTTAKG